MTARSPCTCAPRVTCPACRAWAHQQPDAAVDTLTAGTGRQQRAKGTYYDRHRRRRIAYQRAYARREQAAAFGHAAAKLACCGQWRNITALPHRCAQCGQVYLQQTQKGRTS